MDLIHGLAIAARGAGLGVAHDLHLVLGQVDEAADALIAAARSFLVKRLLECGPDYPFDDERSAEGGDALDDGCSAEDVAMLDRRGAPLADILADREERDRMIEERRRLVAFAAELGKLASMWSHLWVVTDPSLRQRIISDARAEAIARENAGDLEIAIAIREAIGDEDAVDSLSAMLAHRDSGRTEEDILLGRWPRSVANEAISSHAREGGTPGAVTDVIDTHDTEVELLWQAAIDAAESEGGAAETLALLRRARARAAEAIVAAQNDEDPARLVARSFALARIARAEESVGVVLSGVRTSWRADLEVDHALADAIAPVVLPILEQQLLHTTTTTDS